MLRLYFTLEFNLSAIRTRRIPARTTRRTASVHNDTAIEIGRAHV